MKENIEIFDFLLSDEEMKKISELDTKESLFFNHQTPETVDRFVAMVEERKEKSKIKLYLLNKGDARVCAISLSFLSYQGLFNM